MVKFSRRSAQFFQRCELKCGQVRYHEVLKNPLKSIIRIQKRMTAKIYVFIPCLSTHLWQNFHDDLFSSFYVKLLVDRQVWQSGVVVSALASINEVDQRRARLVLRWVTVAGFNSRCRTFISVCNQPATKANSAVHTSGVGK